VANSKAIGGIVVIVVIAIVAAAFAMTETDNITDNTEISDVLNDSDTEISDFATLNKNTVEPDNNLDYFIDENGIKRYVISAIDSPDLSD